MNVSIGMNLQPGPWGGGNQFGHILVNYLCSQGVKVSFDLQAPDLDVILLTEPRPAMKISAYSDKDIGRYLLKKNPHAVVIHRINECDERKGTRGVNQRLRRANACADFTVFISSWLCQLFLGQGLKTPGFRVILNGTNTDIFNAHGYIPWNGSDKLRLVTHHWGGGYLKGFDIYERLDRILAEPAFGDKLAFTYIGNVPDKINLINTNLVAPQSGSELANFIRNHHVYLTASQNEPAGMHHIEGAMCGLPLLYRESGALPEYCQGFGISFTAENFEQKLQEMMVTYDHWAARMKEYPHTAERMCENYYQLFLELLQHRDEIVKQRRWWRKPIWLARTLLS